MYNDSERFENIHGENKEVKKLIKRKKNAQGGNMPQVCINTQ